MLSQSASHVATEVLARMTARVAAVMTAEETVAHVATTEALRVHAVSVQQMLQQSRTTSQRCSKLPHGQQLIETQSITIKRVGKSAYPFYYNAL
jgi:hypothetical protein